MSDEPARAEPGEAEPQGAEPARAESRPAQPERGEPGRTVSWLTDPKALRALAHPTRLALVGMLRVHGQLTATQAGELLGESSASCSFHLRQLAKYGLVEEAGGGQRRERPWRATAMATAWPDVSDDPKVADAVGLLSTVIAEHWMNDLRRWIQASPDEPEEWQQAAQFGDMTLYVTAAELTDLGKRIRELVDGYLDRQVKPELRPPDARLVNFLRIAHPIVGRPGSSPTRHTGPEEN
jgi:DNA-binding transcriptional ArsR family regulator